MSDERLLIGILWLLLLAAGVPWLRFLLAFLRRRTSRRLAAGLAGILTAVPLLLLTLGSALGLYLHYPQREFGAAYWASHATERYTMRQDLLESRRLLGLSETQVRQLLGTPTTAYQPQAGVLVYFLGYPPTLTTKVRPDLLVVELKSGQVVAVK